MDPALRLDGSDRDLRRLLSVAEVQAESARAAIRRVGDIAGWRAVECGCGPRGWLLVQEPLRTPPPQSYPHVAAIGSYAALKSRLVGTGVATAAEVDELERSLRQAISADNGWLTSPFMLGLTLRKP